MKEIEITLKGKLIVPDDDVDTLKGLNPEELATVLVRNGKDVKTDVREVYVKGGK